MAAVVDAGEVRGGDERGSGGILGVAEIDFVGALLSHGSGEDGESGDGAAAAYFIGGVELL